MADLPEIAALKRRRRRLLAIVLVLAVTVCVGIKPAYRVVKRWRCGALAGESRELLQKGNLEQAFDRARAAHQLLPEDPRALRAVAEALSGKGDWANATAFWAEVVKRDPAPEARRQYAEAALRTGAVGSAGEQLKLLLAEDSQSSENHLLAARCFVAQRDLEGAVREARKAVELAPANEPAALLLAELLLQAKESYPEGLQRLKTAALGTSPTSLLALVSLSALPDQEPAALMSTAQALRQHPLAEEVHRLKALELELRAAPDERVRRLDEAQKLYTGAEPERLRAFGAWLNTQGEHARVLAAIPDERAFTRKDLLLVRLDAMASLGQWREILTSLQRERVPLEASLVQLFRARCWQELKEPAQAESAWRAALAGAAGDVNTLLYVAGYAERMGVRDQAERAYRTLSQNPKTAQVAYMGLLRVTPRNDTKALRSILLEMTRRWPKDDALANDLAYLDTLLGIDVPQNQAKARKLVEAAPQSLPHRTVLALAELKQGHAAAALQVYDGLKVDWATAAPGAVVVYASVLQQNGQGAAAEQLTAQLPRESLRPEEQQLLAAIRP